MRRQTAEDGDHADILYVLFPKSHLEKGCTVQHLAGSITLVSLHNGNVFVPKPHKGMVKSAHAEIETHHYAYSDQPGFLPLPNLNQVYMVKVQR